MLDDLKRAHAEACQRRDTLEEKMAFYQRHHILAPWEVRSRAVRARREVVTIEQKIRQFVANSNIE